MDKYHKMFNKYKVCVVRITVKMPNGDISNGTGFHIGEGYIVTARHVIEGNFIIEIAGSYQSYINVKKEIYPTDKRIDIAILETDFSLEYYMEKVSIVNSDVEKINYIEIGSHLDDWIGEEFLLTNVLLMGYPPIPLSREPNIVAVKAEVNSVVDKYIGPHPHFIISSVPRGGFSGGPVISEYGFLLGVLTESLGENDKPTEVGFASAISIEPLIELIYKNTLDIGEQTAFIHKLFNNYLK
ncbi:serine protease [Bacillus licheniformis]|uniref:S1 family peptidase n=1 Tax=Bacillus TaxID=1386 RepID=UPI002281FD7C|nr:MULTISPECIES: serine protease [Bacillus]MCY9181355.1 serine protease [Bacillus haynesii]MEC1557204.1 serine protease [Bacillus licheniformis]